MSKYYKIQAVFVGSDLTNLDLYQVSGSISASLSSSISTSDLEDGIHVEVSTSSSVLEVREAGSTSTLKTFLLPEYENRYRTIKAFADSGQDHKGEVRSSTGLKSYSLVTPIEEVISLDLEEQVSFTAISKTGYTFRGWYTGKSGSGEKICSDKVLTLSALSFRENTDYVTGSIDQNIEDLYFAYFI